MGEGLTHVTKTLPQADENKIEKKCHDCIHEGIDIPYCIKNDTATDLFSGGQSSHLRLMKKLTLN